MAFPPSMTFPEARRLPGPGQGHLPPLAPAASGSRMGAMLRLPGLLFFASGAAGLVYQVVWMRHAALHLGGTTAAAGTVVATFLGGLALGSFWGGRVVDRAIRTRRPGFG